MSIAERFGEFEKRVRRGEDPTVVAHELRDGFIKKASGGCVLKVDDGHGLVLGFAIICKRDGEDYIDRQDDHISEDVMLGAAVDFMQNSGIAKEMHLGDAKGKILFAFPLTTDIAKAFGIETDTTGLMIAMKPDDPAMLAKFRDGTYSGFSIGGYGSRQ